MPSKNLLLDQLLLKIILKQFFNKKILSETVLEPLIVNGSL